MYLGPINFIYVPGIYVIMNCKKLYIYEKTISKINDIITCNNKYPVNMNTITIDFEVGLTMQLKKYIQMLI